MAKDRRATRMEPMEAYDWVEKHHMVALNKTIAGQAIFRGIKSHQEQYLYVKPSQFTRKSRNTSNYYTALLDILPSWQEYPKRSKSLICSSGYDYASGYMGYEYDTYGSVYYVLPKNGSKIGICPEKDIWDSFDQVKDRWGASNMNNFNYSFSDLISLLGIDMDSDVDAEEMRKILERADKIDVDVLLKSGNIDWILEIDIGENKVEANRTWLEYFDDLLDPKKNRFTLTTIENYDLDDFTDNEVWTDGDSLLVSMTEFDEKGNRQHGAKPDLVRTLYKKVTGENPKEIPMDV